MNILRTIQQKIARLREWFHSRKVRRVGRAVSAAADTAAAGVGFTVIGVYDDFYAPRWEDVKANSRRAIQSLEELL